MDDLALKLLVTRLDQLDERIDGLSIKVDELVNWRWKLVGMATVIGFIGSLAMHLVLKVV
jgi:hypothetical protein